MEQKLGNYRFVLGTRGFHAFYTNLEMDIKLLEEKT